VKDVDRAFRIAARLAGLLDGPRRPTPHALRQYAGSPIMPGERVV